MKGDELKMAIELKEYSGYTPKKTTKKNDDKKKSDKK